jgi:hypothetical protein
MRPVFQICSSIQNLLSMFVQKKLSPFYCYRQFFKRDKGHWVWWCTPVISTLWRLRQENHELRPAWATARHCQCLGHQNEKLWPEEVSMLHPWGLASLLRSRSVEPPGWSQEGVLEVPNRNWVFLTEIFIYPNLLHCCNHEGNTSYKLMLC